MIHNLIIAALIMLYILFNTRISSRTTKTRKTFTVTIRINKRRNFYINRVKMHRGATSINSGITKRRK
jgi:hypothetical protein